MRIQIAVATLFCVSSISYSAVAAVTTGDEEEVRKLIVAMAANSETVRQDLQTIENSYEIVFIPGILGSMLRIGDFTYGDDKLTADKLVYNAGLKVTPDQEVPCETLNQFNLRTKN